MSGILKKILIKKPLRSSKKEFSQPSTSYAERVTGGNEDNNDLPFDVCRICLAMNIKMYDIMKHNLNVKYEKVTGLEVLSNDKLPQKLCWECVARLLSANKLRIKASTSRKILLNKIKGDRFVTKSDIKQIYWDQLTKKSSLVTHITKPNTSYIHIIEYEEELVDNNTNYDNYTNNHNDTNNDKNTKYDNNDSNDDEVITSALISCDNTNNDKNTNNDNDTDNSNNTNNDKNTNYDNNYSDDDEVITTALISCDKGNFNINEEDRIAVVTFNFEESLANKKKNTRDSEIVQDNSKNNEEVSSANKVAFLSNEPMYPINGAIVDPQFEEGLTDDKEVDTRDSEIAADKCENNGEVISANKVAILSNELIYPINREIVDLQFEEGLTDDEEVDTDFMLSYDTEEISTNTTVINPSTMNENLINTNPTNTSANGGEFEVSIKVEDVNHENAVDNIDVNLAENQVKMNEIRNFKNETQPQEKKKINKRKKENKKNVAHNINSNSGIKRKNDTIINLCTR